MTLSKEFRKTKIGLIPTDWELKTVREISHKVTVGIACAATHAYRDKGILMLRNLNIKEGHIDNSDPLYLDPDYEKRHIKKRLKTGDVITVRTGYPGLSAVVDKRYENAQCFTSLITRPNSRFILSQYLCDFINSPVGKRQFTLAEAGGAQKNVNAGMLVKILVPIPELTEQKGIINVLSTWDRAIGQTQKLIDTKTRLKRGLMQQLLTGQIRLKGFRGSKIKVCSLGDMLKDIKGGGTPAKNNPQFWNGEIPWATVKDLQGATRENTIDHITTDGLSNSASNQIPKGTVIIATRMAVGKVVRFTRDVAINQDLKALFPKCELESRYLFHYMIFRQKALERLGSGSTVNGIRLEILISLKIMIPEIDEQLAISTILDNCDNQIHILELVKERLNAQKKALMQVLLTGKVRVKV